MPAMPNVVISGAKLACTEGSSPGTLTVLPTNATDADEQPTATVDDHLPMVNIAPFGMCRSLANPQVAAATGAAQGVLTPQPCVPATNAPWAPGAPNVLVRDRPALTSDSRCTCSWAGSVSVTDSGTADVVVE
jgi:hypothetical protein